MSQIRAFIFSTTYLYYVSYVMQVLVAQFKNEMKICQNSQVVERANGILNYNIVHRATQDLYFNCISKRKIFK